MQRFLSRIGIVGRLCQFFWRERLWWMIPLVVLLLLIGGLILVSHSSAVLPFIYTLF